MKKLYYDIKKCLGCKSCEVACAVAHSQSKDLLKALKEEAISLPRKKVYKSGDKNFPVSCRHCEDHPCVDACMAYALVYDKHTGLVVHDETRCVGCWMCVMVCPYGVIRSLPDERKAIKCDRICFDDTEKPACVRACPTGALTYATVDQYGSERRTAFLVKALSKE